MRGLLGRIVGYFKIEHLFLLVPICGFALYDSVFQAFSSILAVLKDQYPDVSITVIQMIVAIPPMASIPGTLLAGLLASYVRKKRIAQFALVVIFVGGVIPVVFQRPTIYAMFICSICVGLGQGLLHPMANAFICQTWEDNERSRALGFKQAFNYVGDAIVALCVGVLALSHWGNAFLIYLGIIPIFILTMVLFPKGEPDKRLISKEERLAGIKELFKPRMIYLIVLFLFAMMFLYGFNTNIAMLIQGRELGATVDVSRINSAVSIASFVLGVCYGKVTKLMGRYTLTLGFVLLAAGMLTACFGSSLLIVLCGSILFGIGMGIQQISTIYFVSKTVDKSVITMAIAVTVSFISLGASLSPVVLNGLQEVLFGSTAPHQALLLAGFGYVVLAITEGTVSRLRNVKDLEVPENIEELD